MSTIVLQNTTKLSHHHPITMQWYVDAPNGTNKGLTAIIVDPHQTHWTPRASPPKVIAVPKAPPQPTAPVLPQAQVQSASTALNSGHSYSHHWRSTHKHRSHQWQWESTTLPPPHKVQHTIVHGEFVDFSDLLCEHLTWEGKSQKPKKATHAWHVAWGMDPLCNHTSYCKAPQLAPE